MDVGQLSHDTDVSERAVLDFDAFEGRQKMICEVLKDGVPVRKAAHYVRIGIRR